MYICIYIYTHTNIYIHTLKVIVCFYICMYVSECITLMYVLCMYEFTTVMYVFVCTNAFMFRYIYIYIYIYTHTHTLTHTHTHIHTYIHTP
jgi:hypothetical protein